MRKTLIVSFLSLVIGITIGYFTGTFHTGKVAGTMINNRTMTDESFILLIEDALNKPSLEKSESIRELLISAQEANEGTKLIIEAKPFSQEIYRGNAEIMKEAINRLKNQKIELKYQTESKNKPLMPSGS